MPIYQYANYDFQVTSELKNFMPDLAGLITEEMVGSN
jgi:hypothetical protein